MSPIAHRLRERASTGRGALALAALMLLAAPPVLAGDWADLPLPPRSQAELVLGDGLVNGLQMHVQRVTTELSVDEVLQFYRRRWSGPDLPEPQAVQRNGWRALATLDGTRQITVQVRPAEKGAEALLTQMDIGHPQRGFVPNEMPKLGGVQVTQVTESRDGPRRSRLVTLVSDEGFDLQVQRWTQAWQRAGWALGQQREQRDANGLRTWLATFERGAASADQVLSYEPRQRRSYSTVNLMDSPR